MFSLRADGFSWADCVVVFEQLGRFCVPGPLVASLLLGDGRITGLVDRTPSPIVDRASRHARRRCRARRARRAQRRRRARSSAEPSPWPLDPLTPVTKVACAARRRHDQRRRGRRSARAGADAHGRAATRPGRSVHRARRRVREGARAVRPPDRLVPGDQAPAAPTCSCAPRSRGRRVRAGARPRRRTSRRDADHAAGHGAKVVAGDAAIANGKAATQVFGGMGFTWEVDVHLYLKRAWVLDTHFGSADRTQRSTCVAGDALVAANPDATVRSHDATADHCARGARRAPRLRSRRSVSRLRQGDSERRLPAREMDAESTRLAHALAARGRRARRSRRDAARQPGRAGRELLRGVEARRGAGADQHRVQGRVPAPPARRLAARRCSSSRATTRPARPRRSAPRRRPTLTHCITVDAPDAVIDAVPAIRWADALAAGQRRRRSTRRRSGPATSRASSTRRARPARSKGCMLPQNYIVSLADQIARAWQRRPDDIVLTPLPLFHFNAISICVVGTLLTGGSARDRAPFLGEQLLARDQAHRRHDGVDARVARDPHRQRRRSSRSARPQAAAVRGRADAARHRPRVAGAVRLQDVQRGLRPHRGVAHVDARPRASRTSPARRASRTSTSSTFASSTTTTSRWAPTRSARSCAGRTART